MTSKCDLSAEVNSRIRAAVAAVSKLDTNVFCSHEIKLATKISVYLAIVLPDNLYSAEIWTVYRRHMRKLDQYHLDGTGGFDGVAMCHVW